MFNTFIIRFYLTGITFCLKAQVGTLATFETRNLNGCAGIVGSSQGHDLACLPAGGIIQRSCLAFMSEISNKAARASTGSPQHVFTTRLISLCL